MKISIFIIVTDIKGIAVENFKIKYEIISKFIMKIKLMKLNIQKMKFVII